MNNQGSDMFSFSIKLWFNPRRVSANGEVSLYLQVVIDSGHREFPLKLRWPVKFIDKVNACLLARQKKDPDITDYNLEINTHAAKFNDILKRFRLAERPIDFEIFSEQLRTYDQRACFITYFKNEVLRRYGRKEIELRTKMNHLTVRRQLMVFDPICNFQSINLKWLKAFKNHLINHEFKPGKKYQPGTIWASMKTVKTYLQLASEEPLLYVNENVFELSNPKPTSNTLFCNKDELRRLMMLHRAGYLTTVQQHVLSAYLFQCFTSLRISDVYRVGANWRVDGEFLYFIPKKNFKKQKWLRIPIMPMANNFITEATGRYFDLPSEKEYNETLKELAAMAQIKKPLTSHSGRHTFGYLYMTTVGNLKGLQEIMGHSKIETTERYAHLDDEYQTHAVNLIQNQFSDLVLRVV